MEFLYSGFEQIGPGLRHVLDQLGVDQEGDGELVDGEPRAVGGAEHLRQLVEVDRLERRDQALGRGVDGRGREVVGGVGLGPVPGLVQGHHGRGRAEVVVDDLDRRVARLEALEHGPPVGPGRPGVERDDHALLARLVVEGGSRRRRARGRRKRGRRWPRVRCRRPPAAGSSVSWSPPFVSRPIGRAEGHGGAGSRPPGSPRDARFRRGSRDPRRRNRTAGGCRGSGPGRCAPRSGSRCGPGRRSSGSPAAPAPSPLGPPPGRATPCAADPAPFPRPPAPVTVPSHRLA